MRLTNNLRDAFVRAVMQDVPKEDFKEKTRVAMQEDAFAQLPPKVQAIHKDKALRHFVSTQDKFVSGGYYRVPSGGDFTPSSEMLANAQAWEKLSSAQDAKLGELRGKIRGCAYACSTRKQLLEMLPEFEKYLPADEVTASRTLPVLTNVVNDFIKAGWPAGGKKASK